MHILLLTEFTSLLPWIGFRGGSVVKNPSANAGDASSNPGSGRSPGGRNATHSSVLAWEIPWTEERGDYGSWGPSELDILIN